MVTEEELDKILESVKCDCGGVIVYNFVTNEYRCSECKKDWSPKFKPKLLIKVKT